MSKQFAVQAGPYAFEVEATRFGASDGELLFYDKDEKIVHQFHSWTGVRTLTPAPAEQAVNNAVENVCRADAEAMERQALAAETKASDGSKAAKADTAPHEFDESHLDLLSADRDARCKLESAGGEARLRKQELDDYVALFVTKEVPAPPANESEAYREGYKNRMSCETPERRDERRGWDDADNAVRAAGKAKEA